MDLVNVAQTAIMQNYDIKGKKRLLQTLHFTELAPQTNNFERIKQVRPLSSKIGFFPPTTKSIFSSGWDLLPWIRPDTSNKGDSVMDIASYNTVH